MPKIKLGIHTATSGLRSALVEKVVENCMNIIYTALIKIPNAKWNPLPPRILRQDIHTPMMHRIKPATGCAVRLYFST